jgi:carbamoyl-phosphate synthase small subunit
MSYLALADGTVWPGESVGADGNALGEAVFTTGMSGYQEAVTDPSFEDQLICFTAPMVGNYGVAEERSESARTHARAVLMREARGPHRAAGAGVSGRAPAALPPGLPAIDWTDWLKERGVVALTGIDTRSLVLHLRDAGSALGIAVASDLEVEKAIELAAQQPPMLGRALVEGVSTDEPYVFAKDGRVRVAVVDYGVKNSVLRRLAKAGAAVTVYPHDADADELARHDGVLLSPGPGDPEPLEAETQTVRDLLGRTHVLGICLGHQLIARATGHETYKLPFGHRGTNHPVHERLTGRVLVTSQNHGFAVRASEAAEVSHVSLYDGTVEGLDLPELRARSLQFHPEAGPGPHDAWPLLEAGVEEVANA